jgi:hypothetical protein
MGLGMGLVRSAGSLVLLAGCGLVRGQCTADWQPLPAGVHPDDWVYVLQSWDPDGPGPERGVLVLGGLFTSPGRSIAAWDGRSAYEIGNGTNGTVRALTQFAAPGSKPVAFDLIVGGVFWEVGGLYSRPVARWDGSAWYAMPGIEHSVPTLTRPYVDRLGMFEGEVWASGIFNRVNGQPADNQAIWNGLAWRASPVGVYTYGYHVHQGQLYIAGYFAGWWTVPPSNRNAGVLRWTGSGWATVGLNYPDSCNACTTWNNLLVCGGLFDDPTTPGRNIAAWNGTTWLPLGSGISGNVWALQAFDPDGAGPGPELLFAGGAFLSAGGQPASCIAAWDGANWHALGVGLDGRIESMAVYENQLYMGGRFTMAGGQFSPHLARWGCPQPAPCYANCDLSTVAPLLNIDDFTCFISQFAAGSSLPHQLQVAHYANCDQSTTQPVLNVDDFTCFINRFAVGCE